MEEPNDTNIRGRPPLSFFIRHNHPIVPKQHPASSSSSLYCEFTFAQLWLPCRQPNNPLLCTIYETQTKSHMYPQPQPLESSIWFPSHNQQRLPRRDSRGRRPTLPLNPVAGRQPTSNSSDGRAIKSLSLRVFRVSLVRIWRNPLFKPIKSIWVGLDRIHVFFKTKSKPNLKIILVQIGSIGLGLKII